jgi:putative endonuclease
MSQYNRRLGKWGEELAESYLTAQGVQVLGRNVYTPHGELDLVGREGAGLVFFEVKTRTNRKFGYPEEAVTARKQQHLTNSALHYMQNHPEESGGWRIDVIAIQKTGDPKNPYQIEWFKNAVQ